MKALAVVFVSALLMLGSLSAQAGSMYSWTDEEGVTHLSNTAPPESAKDVKRYEMPEERKGSKEKANPKEAIPQSNPKESGEKEDTTKTETETPGSLKI